MSESTLTYKNGSTTLGRHLRVFDSGGTIRPAGDSELEHGVTQTLVPANADAGILIVDAPGRYRFIANGPISADAEVFRANGGKVAASGSSKLGTAFSAATADGDEIAVEVEPVGAAAAVLPANLLEHLGSYDPIANSPAITDAGGSNGNVYLVEAPVSEQARDFGSGPITFKAGFAGVLIHDGTKFVWRPSTDSGGGDMLAANNLSELTNVPDARTNLGLGALALLSTVNSTSLLANDIVTFAKLQDVSTSIIVGRTTAGSGDAEQLTATQVRTLLNVADGANAYVHPNHSGDVTSTGDGATTIANDAATNAKLANMPGWSFKMRYAGTTGDPSDVALAGFTEELSPQAGDFVLMFLATGEAVVADASNFLGGGGGDLFAANNLSDVASIATSRTNLGINAERLEDLGNVAGPTLNISYANVSSTNDQRDRKFTATGDVAIALPAAASTPSGAYVILAKQDATGGRAITVSTSVLDDFASPPVIDTDANKTSLLRVYNDKTAWFWM